MVTYFPFFLISLQKNPNKKTYQKKNKKNLNFVCFHYIYSYLCKRFQKQIKKQKHMRQFIKHIDSFMICDKWAEERSFIGLGVVCD